MTKRKIDPRDLEIASLRADIARLEAKLSDTEDDMHKAASVLGGDPDCYDSLADHIRKEVARLTAEAERLKALLATTGAE